MEVSYFYRFMPEDISLYHCKSCKECRDLFRCQTALKNCDLDDEESGKYYQVERSSEIVKEEEFEKDHEHSQFIFSFYLPMHTFSNPWAEGSCSHCKKCSRQKECDILPKYVGRSKCLYNKIKLVVTEISKETYFQKNRLIRQNQSVKKLGTNNFNNCDGWFDEYFG